MNQVVLSDRTIYLAGQVANDRSADIRTQAREVLSKIDSLLELAGSERKKLLSVNVYLSDIRDFAALNEVYDAWVEADAMPVRACTEARLADPSLKVEMTAVASI